MRTIIFIFVYVMFVIPSSCYVTSQPYTRKTVYETIYGKKPPYLKDIDIMNVEPTK